MVEFYKRKSKISIGRSKQCDIQYNSPYISYLHCVIEDDRLIDQSKNGIKVNGIQVEQIKLQENDHIQILDLHIFYLFGKLCIDHPQYYKIHLEKSPPSLQDHIRPFELQKGECPTLELDLLAPPKLATIQSSWMMIGPSFVMAITMLLSNLVSEIKSKSTYIMLAGMCISMVFFPLLHAFVEKRKIQKKNKTACDLYDDYLKELSQTLLQHIEQESSFYQNIHQIPHIGWFIPKWHITFHYPRMELVKSENELKLLEIIEHLPEVSLPFSYDLFNWHSIIIKGKYRYDYVYYLSLFCLERKITFQVVVKNSKLRGLSYMIEFQQYFLLKEEDEMIILTQEKGEGEKEVDCNNHDFFPYVSENDFLRTNQLYLIKKQDCLLDFLGIDTLEEIDLLKQYQLSRPYSSLKIPIGNQIFLDLHEKQDGPHGVLAGMTGSGKSEFLITMILMLSLYYSPLEVSFFIIDYKGGGLSDVFYHHGKKLPHIANVMQNLMEDDLLRVIYGLSHEIKVREKLFQSVKQQLHLSRMDIDQYQKLFRQGKVEKPLSHLFIIIDEFAELKTSHPDMIQQIIHIARIGRSLGFHLLLTTQKPGGIINQQIWSNTNYHICMQVLDVMDSMDMIHSKEAINLQEAGEFILQSTGSNELKRGKALYLGNPYIPRSKVEILPRKQDAKECESDALIHYIIENVKQEATPIYQSMPKSFDDDVLGYIDAYKECTFIPFQIEIEDDHYIVYGEDGSLLYKLLSSKENVNEYIDETSLDNQDKILIIKEEKLSLQINQPSMVDHLFNRKACIVYFCKDPSRIKYSYLHYFPNKIAFSKSDEEDKLMFNMLPEMKIKRRKGVGYIYKKNMNPIYLNIKEAEK